MVMTRVLVKTDVKVGKFIAMSVVTFADVIMRGQTRFGTFKVSITIK